MKTTRPAANTGRAAADLTQEEIVALAHEARLMIADGAMSFMNDMATQKELLAFARMIEARLPEGGARSTS